MTDFAQLASWGFFFFKVKARFRMNVAETNFPCFVLRKDGKQMASFFHISVKSTTEWHECPHLEAEEFQAHSPFSAISTMAIYWVPAECEALCWCLLIPQENQVPTEFWSQLQIVRHWTSLFLSLPTHKKVTDYLPCCTQELSEGSNESPHVEAGHQWRGCYSCGNFVFIWNFFMPSPQIPMQEMEAMQLPGPRNRRSDSGALLLHLADHTNTDAGHPEPPPSTATSPPAFSSTCLHRASPPTAGSAGPGLPSLNELHSLAPY